VTAKQEAFAQQMRMRGGRSIYDLRAERRLVAAIANREYNARYRLKRSPVCRRYLECLHIFVDLLGPNGNLTSSLGEWRAHG
jgi:hypothetical protein